MKDYYDLMRKRPFSAMLIILALSLMNLGNQGCAGSKYPPSAQSSASSPSDTHNSTAQALSPEAAAVSGNAKKLWTRRLPGLISDLNVARNGEAILVATIPDPERGLSKHLLSRLDRQGATLWSVPLTAQLKSQALSDDGSLAVVSNYDEELLGLDSKGKTLWKTSVSCKPVVLSKARKIICYHDDDAAPDIAFDVFSWEGKKLSSFANKSDILVLKPAQDEERFALALTRGQVLLFDSNAKKVWLKKVPGEVLDLAISSGSKPLTAVLYNLPKEGQKISVFDQEGELVSEGVPSLHAEQIEIAPKGEAALVYGNGPKGQYLALFPIPAPSQPESAAAVMKERWKRGEPKPADYSSSMIAGMDLAIIGLEDTALTSRKSELVAYDFQGGMKWAIPVITEEGAYLYAQSYSPDKDFLSVGTDDGNLSAYQIISR